MFDEFRMPFENCLTVFIDATALKHISFVNEL